MPDRPHILFLMSDEHRPDVAGYEGNDVVRTPVLDELAATGVVFRNAYTPSPICVPARQCMMSGQLPKTCHCEGWIDLAPGYMTWSRRLAQYGYYTACSGKLHHEGSDAVQGWMGRPAGDLRVDPRHWGAVPEELAKYVRPFGDYKWSDTKEAKRAGAGKSQIMRNDELWTQAAIDLIDERFASPWYDREQPQQPICLKVSLLEPHYPYATDEEKFSYYLNRVPVFLDEPVSDHPFLSKRQVRPGVDALERELRRATACYYGMVETIDSHYGRVIDRLRHLGQDLDDWIIIYTSDHGEMLGEHGIWEKQKFYEASARVPLIIRWPKRFAGGRVVTENVNLCDLFATICELCDVPVPAGLDSRSLVPLLEGNASGWRNESVSEFGNVNFMIKQDDLKYQYYGPDQPEVLFDLAADPRERTNVIDEPAYAEAVAAFRQRMSELGHGPDADPDYVNAGYA